LAPSFRRKPESSVFGFWMTPTIEKFLFRGLHPGVSIGTASDRYAGWLGQIYSTERFGGKISKRSKTVGGQTVTEELLR